MHVGVYLVPAKAGIQYHCLFLDSRWSLLRNRYRAGMTSLRLL